MLLGILFQYAFTTSVSGSVISKSGHGPRRGRGLLSREPIRLLETLHYSLLVLHFEKSSWDLRREGFGIIKLCSSILSLFACKTYLIGWLNFSITIEEPMLMRSPNLPTALPSMLMHCRMTSRSSSLHRICLMSLVHYLLPLPSSAVFSSPLLFSILSPFPRKGDIFRAVPPLLLLRWEIALMPLMAFRSSHFWGAPLLLFPWHLANWQCEDDMLLTLRVLHHGNTLPFK